MRQFNTKEYTLKTKLYFILMVFVLLSFCKEKEQNKETTREQPNQKKQDLLIENVWIKETPMEQANSAAFMNIENNTDRSIKLTSAESDISEVVELHETIYEEEVMKMRMVESIEIPSKSVVELKPGSFHIMFLNLKRDVKEGQEISLILNFEGMGAKTVLAKVKKHESMMHKHHQ